MLSPLHRTGGLRLPYLEHLPYVTRRQCPRLDDVRSSLHDTLERSLTPPSYGLNPVRYIDILRTIASTPQLKVAMPRLFLVGGTVRDAVYDAHQKKTRKGRSSKTTPPPADIDVTLLFCGDHNRPQLNAMDTIKRSLQRTYPSIRVCETGSSGIPGYYIKLWFEDGGKTDSRMEMEIVYVEHPRTYKRREGAVLKGGYKYFYLLDSPGNSLMFDVATEGLYDVTGRGIKDAIRQRWRCPYPIPKDFPWTFFETFTLGQDIPRRYLRTDILNCLRWLIKGRVAPTSKARTRRRRNHTLRFRSLRGLRVKGRYQKFVRRGYHVPQTTRRLVHLPLLNELQSRATR